MFDNILKFALIVAIMMIVITTMTGCQTTPQIHESLVRDQVILDVPPQLLQPIGPLDVIDPNNKIPRK